MGHQNCRERLDFTSPSYMRVLCVLGKYGCRGYQSGALYIYVSFDGCVRSGRFENFDWMEGGVGVYARGILVRSYFLVCKYIHDGFCTLLYGRNAVYYVHQEAVNFTSLVRVYGKVELFFTYW